MITLNVITMVLLTPKNRTGTNVVLDQKQSVLTAGDECPFQNICTFQILKVHKLLLVF